MSDPLEVVLQFAVLGVLYLFLLWVARSALRDLGRPATEPGGLADDELDGAARPYSGKLVVQRGGGLATGQAFGIGPGLVMRLAQEPRVLAHLQPAGDLGEREVLRVDHVEHPPVGCGEPGGVDEQLPGARGAKDPHLLARQVRTLVARGTQQDDSAAQVVEDGRYLSARWPGDAYLLARKFRELLEARPGAADQSAPSSAKAQLA